jgi:hypothetical protein
MKQLPKTITFIMENGVLTPKTSLDKYYHDNYLKNVEEGTVLQVTYEYKDDDGTYPQISKLQACTRELSKFLGYTHEEVKDMIKIDSGLYNEDKSLKSFADCSKEELSRAIDAVITLGELVEYPLD